MVFATLLPLSASAQGRPVRNVLTIHQSAEFFPANRILDAAIRETLLNDPAVAVDYYAEYLESDRFGADATRTLAEYTRQKYRGRHIDVVIAMTNDSLQFALGHRPDLFPDAPIVFAGLAVPEASVRNAGAGLAAVRVGSAYAQSLRAALKLQPETERVFVIAKSPNPRNVQAARAELDQFSQRVKLAYLDAATTSELLDQVRNLPPKSLVLHIWHRTDGNGARAEELARMVAAASKAPVYGTTDMNIGTGIVGGVVRGTRETGLLVGQLALQILNGTRAQDIPVEDAPLVPMFDWRQLKRFGIDRSRLPPGSIIQYWTPSVWETYGAYIIGAIVIFAAQLLAIGGLIIQRERRRRAEHLLTTSEATIRMNYQRIRQLARRLMNAQEATRADIARDLHDGVCQELAGVSIAVGRLKGSHGTIEDPTTQDALSKIQHETRVIFEDIRRLSHELHPATLRLIGLPDALEAHCKEVEARHAVRVTFETNGQLGNLHSDVAVCLFRIAQEALRNATVHGDARQLAVSLVRSNQDVELTITDDGRGFDLDTVNTSGVGLGLISIDERAHAVGGCVEIRSVAGRGTTIRVRGPVAPDGTEPASLAS
jgi:signal transduction histidine kinase